MIASIRSSVSLLLVIAGVFSSANAAGNLRHTSRALGATYTTTSSYESQMLEAVNKQRSAQGLSSLCLNSKLVSSATRHSNDMAKNNYMAHNGSDGSTMEERITEAGFDWTAVGENVAAGQEDVDAVMTAWMNSPEHKANILGDYAMFGCAYAYNADTEYLHYWTQDFGTGDNESCEGSSSSTTSDSTDQTAQQTTTSDSTDQTAQQDTTTSTTSDSTAQQEDDVAGEAETTAETTAPITEETSTPSTTTPATTAPSTSGCKARK